MQLLGAECMHASRPAGSDRRLPKRCMYPGALALYSELDIGFGLRLKVSCSAALTEKVTNLLRALSQSTYV